MRLTKPDSSDTKSGELAAPSDPDKPVTDSTTQMADILKRLDVLEKSAKAPEEMPVPKQSDGGGAKAADKAAEKPVIGEWVDMSADKWNVRLGGHMQLDSINWAEYCSSGAGVQLHRVSPVAIDGGRCGLRRV